MLANSHALLIKDCATRMLEAEKDEKNNRFIRAFGIMHKNVRSDSFHLALRNLKSSYVDIHGEMYGTDAMYIMGQLLSLAGVSCDFYDRTYLMHIRMNIEYKGSMKECVAPKVARLDFAREKHVVVIHDHIVVKNLLSVRTYIDINVRTSRDGCYCVIF